MKVIKLTKRDLNLSPDDLLRKVGAVNEDLQRAYPSEVHMSEEDYKTLAKNVKAKFRKEYPYISKKALESAVGMCLLNYGPNTSAFSKAIKPGFVVVDTDKLETEMARDAKEESHAADANRYSAVGAGSKWWDEESVKPTKSWLRRLLGK